MKPLDTTTNYEFEKTIIVKTVTFDGVTLQAKNEILLDIAEETDEEGNIWLCVEKDELGISVHAKSLEELLIILNSQFIMLWREYALASDESLSIDAKELKYTLLSTFEEIKSTLV